MKVGTKSLLFGAHQFILHPIFVFIAWWRLYGFPKDPRLWVAFLVHDWGYWGKPNMDGKEGETHVELGAKIMHWLFDKKHKTINVGRNQTIMTGGTYTWYNFTLYHSRFYAKKNNHPISKLCVADKLAFTIPPKWLYLLFVTWSGEIYEYMHKGRADKYYHSKTGWYDIVYQYMIDWVEEHKDNLNDTWTKTK